MGHKLLLRLGMTGKGGETGRCRMNRLLPEREKYLKTAGGARSFFAMGQKKRAYSPGGEAVRQKMEALYRVRVFMLDALWSVFAMV
jgi:hypothetical protein